MLWDMHIGRLITPTASTVGDATRVNHDRHHVDPTNSNISSNKSQLPCLTQVVTISLVVSLHVPQWDRQPEVARPRAVTMGRLCTES